MEEVTSTKNVSERFLIAREQQVIRQNERMQSIRSQFHEDLTCRKSVTGHWDDVLQRSKYSSEDRYERQRRNTIDSFLGEHKNGLVRRRISQYEEMFIQLSASREKIEATIKASRSQSCVHEITGDSSSHPGEEEEEYDLNVSVNTSLSSLLFICGRTVKYSFVTSSMTGRNLLDVLELNSLMPTTLLCGVHGDSEFHKEFEIVAVAMCDSSHSEHPKQLFIAVTLNRIGNSDDLSSPAISYGEKRISFFPDDDAENQSTPIWDAVFDIAPMVETMEDFVMSHSDDEVQEENDASSCHLVDPVYSQSIGDIVKKSAEGDDIASLLDTPDFDSHEHGQSEEFSNVGTDEMNDDLLECETHEELNTMCSLSKGEGMPEVVNYPVQFSCTFQGSGQSKLTSWTEDDEATSCTNGSYGIALEGVIVDNIINSNCTSMDLALKTASKGTIIAISSLKYCVRNSDCFVTNSFLFEWVRGIAKSGWCIKWPMKNQKAGMRTRRFLVLRDCVLSYHRQAPSSQKEFSIESAMHTIRLTESTRVLRSRHHLLSCVKVECFIVSGCI
jgi:hypothetical protein